MFQLNSVYRFRYSSDFYLINDPKPNSDLGILSEPLSFDGNTTNLRVVMPNSISDQVTYLKIVLSISPFILWRLCLQGGCCIR